MSDQSRVEAVARAIDQSGCWETYDDLMRTGGYFPSDALLERLEKSRLRAQAAIEANDDWLKGRRKELMQSMSRKELSELVLDMMAPPEEPNQ